MRMNKRGYTLIEILLAMSLSMIVLYAVILIPNRIMTSFDGYLNEVENNRNTYHLSTAIHTDLRQHLSIQETTTGFIIGESEYIFGDDGVQRTSSSQSLTLSDRPLMYVVAGDFLYITTEATLEEPSGYHATIDLVFPITLSSFVIEEGVK